MIMFECFFRGPVLRGSLKHPEIHKARIRKFRVSNVFVIFVNGKSRSWEGSSQFDDFRVSSHRETASLGHLLTPRAVTWGFDPGIFLFTRVIFS